MPNSEQLANEFMSQGRPAEAVQPAGECLGGFEVMTPKVGRGFVDWAIKDFSLDGESKSGCPPGVDYSRNGDWRFDRETDTEGSDYVNVKNKK